MGLYYSALISVFAIVLALMIIDPNVGVYLDLQLKNLWVQIKRQWYLLTIGTTIKIQDWKIKREINKMRREYKLSDEKSE